MKRSQPLDVLRGIAILLVLGRHAPYYSLWTRAGWTGVQLFFVLSGFLISGLLFAEYDLKGQISFSRFFVRRAFKIWPGYYALLGATGGFYLFFVPASFPRTPFLIAASYLSNYFHRPEFGVIPLGQIWSLAVEEHFYVVLPLLLIVLGRLGNRRRDPFPAIPLLAMAALLGCFLIRGAFLPAGEFATRTDMVCDSLLVGVCLGYFQRYRPLWFSAIGRSSWLLCLAAILWLPAFLLEVDAHIMQTLGLAGLTIGFGIAVAWGAARTRIGGWTGDRIAEIGVYSYSIYLWHMFLSPLFLNYRLTFLSFWIFVGSSVAVGILMALLIEIPFLRLRDRICPREHVDARLWGREASVWIPNQERTGSEAASR